MTADAEVSGGSGRLRWLAGAFAGGCWRGLGYLSVGLGATLLGWAVALVAIFGGVLLSVTVVGVSAAPALLWLVRAAARLERYRLRLVRVAPLADPHRPVDGSDRRARLADRLRDPATWRDLLWLLLAAPVNLVGFVLAAGLWVIASGLLSIPIWYRFLPGGQAKFYTSAGVAHGVIDSVPAALPWAAAGLVLLWVAGWLTRGVSLGEAALAAGLLGPTRNTGLRARVRTLSTTRAAAVDGQQRELRRIERDLHDGAQARLVALGADLGLAVETFEADPGMARALVGSARDEVGRTLAELRDLVRGIGPPILADRGLAAALEAVAARSTIPVSVTVTLPRRPPAAAETAAYFVACEALVNAGKHSKARQVTLDLRERHRRWVVTVRDDGIGGADPAGSGLRGLADRVAALDGVFTVDSPVGGPTVVRAELPCE